MLNTLIKELEKEWELETPLPQDMPGVYSIPLEDGLSLSISSIGQGAIFLNSTVALIPKGREEHLYTQALLANLMGQGTKGALLGLNDTGTLLTLSRTIDYDVSFKEFRDIVEDFINTIDFWREEAPKL